MAYTVKAVADLAGISIRTLHHYDAIGLLKPAAVSDAGYRLYTTADLERLQQILFFRELDFSLQEIKAILNSPAFDRRQALLDHRQMLQERRERMTRLIESVDRTLATMERGRQMDEKDLFDGFEPSKYEEEVKQRWGGTREYAESVQRTKQYTQADWEAIKQEMQAITQGVAALMDRAPSDPAVQEWARRWHQTINDRFYTCSLEVYRGLADMWVQDPRFTANYEKVKPGLAQFWSEAVKYYCDANA